MKANDIFFKKNNEKQLIATLGNSDGKSVNISTDDGIFKLRLVAPDSKGALPIRVKMNNNIYALGSFPDGICVKSNEYYTGLSNSDYNKSYIYDITNNSMKLLATVPCAVTKGYYLKEQNMYIIMGDTRSTSTWEVTSAYRMFISFNGYDWKESAIGKIIDVVYKNGKVSILATKYNKSGTYETTLYNVIDTNIQLFRKLTYGEIYGENSTSSSLTYLITDFDGNVYYKETTGNYYIVRYNNAKLEKIDKSSIPDINSVNQEQIFDYTGFATVIKSFITAKSYNIRINDNYLDVETSNSWGTERFYFKIKAICGSSIYFRCTYKLNNSNNSISFKPDKDYFYLYNGSTVISLGDTQSLYFSRIDGKIRAAVIRDSGKTMNILDASGNIEKRIQTEGVSSYSNLYVFCTGLYKSSYDGISPGTFSIKSFWNTLSNYIGENSYRVVASDFTITNGNFSISVLAGQRIWLCSEGESPNYAKAIRFVDDDSDYSGNVPDYVGGGYNYDFYGSGNTGFAKVFKAKGRYGSYYDVSNYDVTVTGNISFK